MCKPPGVLPSKRLLGLCRWMGSHFHNCVDYNGVTFLEELLEWGRTPGGGGYFGVKRIGMTVGNPKKLP